MVWPNWVKLSHTFLQKRTPRTYRPSGSLSGLVAAEPRARSCRREWWGRQKEIICTSLPPIQRVCRIDLNQVQDTDFLAFSLFKLKHKIHLQIKNNVLKHMLQEDYYTTSSLSCSSLHSSIKDGEREANKGLKWSLKKSSHLLAHGLFWIRHELRMKRSQTESTGPLNGDERLQLAEGGFQWRMHSRGLLQTCPEL